MNGSASWAYYILRNVALFMKMLPQHNICRSKCRKRSELRIRHKTFLGTVIFSQLLTMMQQLTITPQLKRIMPLPSSPPTSTSMIVQMSLVDSTGPLANRRQSSRLAMFHGCSTDPVDPSIPTNCI